MNNQPVSENVRTCETRTGGERMPCPICGGWLVPARGTMRCVRCAFSFCLGCEPDWVYCSVTQDEN